MFTLPSDFQVLMREHLGEAQAEALFAGLATPPSVSIRINPEKATAMPEDAALQPVSWCPFGYYVNERPAFTFDPLLHAGVYYVQEASSMYLDEVLRTYMPQGDLVALDLCAAPGGKSTLLRSRLSSNSLLVSNEPMRQRAQVLAENIIKWGAPCSMVTQNFPADFSHLDATFDVIVADVPCSGEGMFRKDEEAVRDWSPAAVDTCWRRQRDIVSDVWHTLKPGGLFVYSTCTFNRFEDEDNVQWIASSFGGEVLTQRHFFPGTDRGEGFFIAALRKPGEWVATPLEHTSKCESVEGLVGSYVVRQTGEVRQALPACRADLMQRLQRTLHTLVAGVQVAERKGKDFISSHALALSTAYARGSYPEVELTYDQAIAYLRREALRIDAPRGMVVVTYRNHPLGFVKSVGNRANNLYPQEWRIRTTYNPSVPCPQWNL